MDIAKAFTFMFEDENWLRKLGIGTVVTLIGIVLSPILIGLVPLIVVMGYTLEVVGNVLSGQARPLPEWEDWNRFLTKGLRLFVVFLVWALPLIIIMIPLAIGSSLADQARNDGVRTLGVLFSICGSCLSLLWSLVLMLFSPAIYVRLARTNRISAGFEFGRLWAFTRDNIGNVIIAVLLGSIVAGLIASIAGLLGVVVLLIGLIISIPLAILWQMLVQAHLYGQVGAKSTSVIE